MSHFLQQLLNSVECYSNSFAFVCRHVHYVLIAECLRRVDIERSWLAVAEQRFTVFMCCNVSCSLWLSQWGSVWDHCTSMANAGVDAPQPTEIITHLRTTLMNWQCYCLCATCLSSIVMSLILSCLVLNLRYNTEYVYVDSSPTSYHSQVVGRKDSSPKWPIMCRVGR